MFMVRFDYRLAPWSTSTMTEQYHTSLEMAEWAERHGAMTALVSEHHASDDGYLPSPIVIASALAARTSTLPITVGALLLLMYDPVKLAEDMAVLDHLSEGRVNYVIGMGYRNEEYASFGVDPTKRAALMEDKLDVLRRALAGERFEWQGRMVKVRPSSMSDSTPAIMYGGGTLAAARRAARLGLPFMPQSSDPALLAAYDEEATRTGGTPGAYRPMIACPHSLFVDEDVDRGWKDYGPYMLHDAMSYGEWLKAAGPAAETFSGAQTVDALRAEHGNYQVVDPDGARELINEFGFLGLQPLCGGIPAELAWRSLKTIESRVLNHA